MQRPLRVLAALAVLTVLSLSPAQGGTQAAPEVTDPAQDQAGPSGAPGCTPAGDQCLSTVVDILAGWVDNETATSLQFHIQTTAAPPSSNQGMNYSFSFTSAGTTYVAGVTVSCGIAAQAGCDSALAPYGVAGSAAITADGVVMTVAKTAIGSPAAGSTLTALTLASRGTLLTTGQAFTSDDAGPGTAYTVISGPGGDTPTDSDADGLDDTWEQDNFGGLDEDETGDGDADGCDNKCEFDNQTDPNEADTDGDGFSDGDEIAAGKDPTDPTSHPDGPGSSSSSGPPPPPPTTGPPSSGPTDSGTSGDGSGGEGDPSDPSQRMQDGFSEGAFGIGYLLIASAGAGVVLLLALIGRGGRWGL